MGARGFIGGALVALLLTGAQARAQDLPTVPFGPPEDTLIAFIDPVLEPRLARVSSAFSDLVLTYFVDLKPGGKWLLLSEAEAQARLGRVIAAEDAGLAAEVSPHGRHRAEWLAATLTHAEAGLGVDATILRAEEAVAIERQLAANTFVFGDYFPGTDVAGVVGAAQSARQAAVSWALGSADILRADGDPALAAALEEKAFVWAQTLSQGRAARAIVRPFRADGPLVAIETLTTTMARTRLIQRYAGAFGLTPAQAAVTEASVAAALATIDAGLAELRDTGVDLAAAILPRPLTLTEVRQRLTPDEALLLVLPGEFYMTILAVSRDDFLWYTTDAYFLEIDEKVAALLGGIGAWSARSAVPLEQLAEAPAGDLAEAAHWLYQQMLAPARRVTGGKARLLISATGTAAHFPWALMVTEPPSPGARYQDMDWLVRDHALVVVPAIEVIGTARARDDGAALSYLGFGAPDYVAGKGTWAARASGLAIIDLPPLPEAAGEVRAVGALYPASGRKVLTGPEASELALEDLSASGALAGYDVVHFATHGLIWGDHPEVIEAMVALSPAGEFRPVTDLTVETLDMAQTDGALTETEIRGLWMDAALVILSACKTAVGQPTDRDGVEGLAAAFLHAGARRVMASHWPVNSDAAVEVVTAMMTSDPGLSDPATALQGAMLGLIAAGGRKADPAYWAPFSIIGAP